MRILHVITGLASGGAETQLRILLQHSCHEADVVALYNAGAVAQQLRQDGVQVIDLGMTTNRQLGAVARLARLIQAGDYDVVHTHLYRACIYGRLAARFAGVRCIVATEHSALDGQLEGRIATPAVRRLYRVSERCGSKTIAISRAVRDELVAWGIPGERIVCIPNGLDLEALAFSSRDRDGVRSALGIDSRTQVIGAVGRLHPGKRFDLLVDAVAPLLDERRLLVLVGDGPERQGLQDRARSLGVSDRVLLVGERPAAPVLSAMDVFASPSPYETFGLALVEAVANGLPVVYRRSPALDELGSAIPGVHLSEDDPGVWRGTLRTMLDRPRARIGETDRIRPAALDRYAIQHVARAVDACYDNIRSGSAAPAHCSDVTS